MYWGFTEVLAQNLACYQDQEEIGQPLSELDYEADAVKEVIEICGKKHTRISDT